MGWCLLQELGYFLSTVYAVLGIFAGQQIAEHWHSFRAFKSPSLLVYLVCCLCFCLLRSGTFVAFSIQEHVDCKDTDSFESWQWDVLDKHWKNSIFYVIIATLPAPLFFTSYSSFWYSLARVYDSFTRSESQRLLFNVVSTMNCLVYASMLIYYIAAAINLPGLYYMERSAEITLATSALVTVGGFMLYAFLIYNHFQALRVDVKSAFGPRLRNFNRNIRFHRLAVVYFSCIITFSIRSVLLLCNMRISNWHLVAYFILLEVFPTAAMLYVFWPTTEEKENALTSHANHQEYQQLLSNISVKR